MQSSDSPAEQVLMQMKAELLPHCHFGPLVWTYSEGPCPAALLRRKGLADGCTSLV